jgi:hypothetical protein
MATYKNPVMTPIIRVFIIERMLSIGESDGQK